MLILGIDSSGPVCSAAVMKDGIIVSSAMINNGLTHSETLMPLVDSVMASAGAGQDALDMIACVVGPGSFTGVRIGVCAAKAMAHALSIPCAGVNALAALSMDHMGFEGAVCPILDARRGQVYSAAYRFDSGELPVRIMDDRALKLDDYLAELPTVGRLMFTGDGVQVHSRAIKEKLGERALIAPPNSRNLSAAAACAMAHYGGADVTDYLGLQPLYLRLSQAERERLEREGGKGQNA